METPTPALAYTVGEAAALLRIGRTLAWRLVREGKIKTTMLGHRRIVPHSAIAELLSKQ
jgi:excisionase family DNA binding protein